MADFPIQGESPYGAKVKMYIDAGDAATLAEVNSLIDQAVEQAVEDHTPGILLGHAERLSTFTTTVGAVIPDLAVTVTGNERPVDFRLFIPAAWHSVANTWIGLRILRDGAQVAQSFAISGSTAAGGDCEVFFQEIVPAGEHVYTGYVFLSAAGTATLFGATNSRMSLTAVSR